MGQLRRFVYPLCIFTLIISPATTYADSDAKPKMPRVDNYGDPLPPGAVARLGTVRFLHPGGGIGAVAISPDGKMVATGDNFFGPFDEEKGYIEDYCTIYLWNAVTGNLLKIIKTPPGGISCLRFSASGKELAAFYPYSLSILNLAENKRVDYKVSDWFGDSEKIVFAGDRLVTLIRGKISCDADFVRSHRQHLIRIWDRRTTKQLPLPTILQPTRVGIKRIPILFHAVAICPKGKYAAIVRSTAEPVSKKNGDPAWEYKNGRLQIMELTSGKVIFEKQDRKTKHITFSPDGQTLACATETSISLLTTRNGRMTQLEKKLPGKILRLTFVGETSTLAAYLENETLWRWNVPKTTFLGAYPLLADQTEFSRDGRLLASVHGNVVRIRSAKSGKIMGGFAEPLDAHSISYAHDSSAILHTVGFRKLGVWNVKKRKKTISFRWTLDVKGPYTNKSIARRMEVTRDDNGWILRDLASQRTIRRLQCSMDYEPHALFSPDGKRIVVGELAEDLTEAGRLYIFDADTGRKISEIRDTYDALNWYPSMLSSKGRYFLNFHNQLTVYDTADGKIVCEPTQSPIVQARFSNDERFVLAEHRYHVESDKYKTVVILWEIHSGSVVARVNLFTKARHSFLDSEGGLMSELGGIRLSVDNRLLAVSVQDSSTIHLYEIASGQKRGEFRGHLEPILDFAFSPDGKHLASSSEDRTILVWDLHRPLNSAPIKKRLTQNELATHWQTLAKKDAKKAEASLWSMIYAPKDSIPFLTQHLPPVAKPDAKRLDQLIRDLDGNFRTRSKASTEIEKLGELALPHLHVALKAKNNLEMTRRLQVLIKKAEHDRYTTDANRLRLGRALEVLEKIGDDDARQLLRRLAGGAEGAWLTREATAAMERLTRYAHR